MVSSAARRAAHAFEGGLVSSEMMKGEATWQAGSLRGFFAVSILPLC
jgi:hypothetical protein